MTKEIKMTKWMQYNSEGIHAKTNKNKQTRKNEITNEKEIELEAKEHWMNGEITDIIFK